MLTKKLRQNEMQKRPKTKAMVTAVLGAVADFPEPPEEKLKAIIQAGRIAEAFLREREEQHSPPIERIESRQSIPLVYREGVSLLSGPKPHSTGWLQKPM
jgi:hypothetical protein